MIRKWLEDHGWTCVRDDEELGDLYAKGCPVAMSTEAALFQELLDAKVDRQRAIASAAIGLVSALDQVHQDPAYRAVWEFAHLHMGPYKGPQYVNALRSLRDALSGSKAL